MTNFVPFEHGILQKQGWFWDKVRGVFENPHFGQVWHVIFIRDGVAQNDQMLRVEAGGGCFIPVDEEGRLGLVQHAMRPQIMDEALHRANFPYKDAIYLTNNIGKPSWEFPRGYAEVGESGDKAGGREGSEETAAAVTSTYEVGKICGNTSIEPHFITVMSGTIDTKRPGLKGDPNEKLLTGVTFFTTRELDKLITRGELYCGITLSALRLYEAH